MTLLFPDDEQSQPPVVVGLAQCGHQCMHKQRKELISQLLARNIAVCLLTVHGMGETRRGDEHRGRRSSATEAAASELMLGDPPLGLMLRDLRTVLAWLRANRSIDPSRIALWGDAFAPTNPARRNITVPWDADPCPEFSEPAAGLTVLLGALFEDVSAVCARGCLSSYLSLLDSPFCFTPRDAVVPGAQTAGDIGDIAAALSPRPLRLYALVDGLNRRVASAAAVTALQATVNTYEAAAARHRLSIDEHRPSTGALADWFARALKTDDESQG